MQGGRLAVAAASLACIVATPPARAGLDSVLLGPTLFSYNAANLHLVCFSASAPNLLMRDIPLTGLFAGEILVGLDFRPATGELYAVATSLAGDRVVTIDVGSGAVTQVSTSLFANIDGAQFGVDFNPVVDRIRVVSDAESSQRLNPSTGMVAAIDTSLAYVPGDPGFGQNPDVVHVAYANNFAGAMTTTLFAIDVARDALVRIGGVDGAPSANGGQLTTIGALGVDAIGSGGFDIDPETGISWAALRVGGVSGLYSIDLTSGAATFAGAIGAGGDFDALAVPESDALASGLCAAITLAWTRRRQS